MKTFAEKVIEFNKKINFKGTLPPKVAIMNPFKENPHSMEISSAFYQKYYNDHEPRSLILGINPGRFGAGITGVPFTDTKRLLQECGIEYHGQNTHEPSATFVYEMIKAYGGVKKFYGKFFIHSICPLGFTIINDKGKAVNYNYYDDSSLKEAVYEFIIKNIKAQLKLGVRRDICYCFGTGKNEKFLREINEEHHFFDQIIGLEHPRFIMQYKAKSKEQYVQKYLDAFRQAE